MFVRAVVVGILISVVTGAVLRQSNVIDQVKKYDLLVDIMMNRAATECSEDSFMKVYSTHVKRAVSSTSASTSISLLVNINYTCVCYQIRMTEPELQLETLKTLYSHWLSQVRECIRTRSTTMQTPTKPIV